MARKLRVQYPGAIYHVMNRGDHLEVIFFSGRYKAKPVDGSGTGYLKSACDYVHLNPVRAGLLTPEQPLQHYRWSSYPLYLLAPERRPTWLRADRLLGGWGIPMDTAAGRGQFALHMEARRKAEATGGFKTLPRGWCMGSEQFRQELLLQMTSVQGSKFAGPEWKETAEKKAEGILAEELERRGWDLTQLDQLPKADPEKLKIAGRLRAQTTVTFKWITEHLSMGAPGYVSDCLRTARH
jgi:putative transposase